MGSPVGVERLPCIHPRERDRCCAPIVGLVGGEGVPTWHHGDRVTLVSVILHSKNVPTPCPGDVGRTGVWAEKNREMKLSDGLTQEQLTL